MENFKEILLNKLKTHKKKNKKCYNTEASVGSLGVSPNYMKTYFNSVKKNKEYENNN